MIRKLTILFLIGIGVFTVCFFYLTGPTGFSSEKFVFAVSLEPNQNTVVNELKEQGFIRSPALFRFLSSMMRYPGIIEPGSYQLTHRMTLFQITDTLLFHPYQRWIILVPGLRKEQVAERLAKKFYWQQDKLDAFLNEAKEGYLFPDTYLLNIDYTGSDFAKRLMNNFNEHLDANLQRDLLAQNVRIDTAVKIASLIERESGGDEDKALIAGIIWNRLNTHMRLQIDATHQYVKGTPADWWPRVVPADHKVDSPYNTYMYDGLPPGPIANPSLASIKAAIYPAETECMYYLHDHNKQIHCAKTYQEHLDNIDRFLR